MLATSLGHSLIRYEREERERERERERSARLFRYESPIFLTDFIFNGRVESCNQFIHFSLNFSNKRNVLNANQLWSRHDVPVPPAQNTRSQMSHWVEGEASETDDDDETTVEVASGPNQAGEEIRVVESVTVSLSGDSEVDSAPPTCSEAPKRVDPLLATRWRAVQLILDEGRR